MTKNQKTIKQLKQEVERLKLEKEKLELERQIKELKKKEPEIPLGRRMYYDTNSSTVYYCDGVNSLF